ncbi:MAG: GNAT family N-acetyltransferase [Burkholderiales bacterium]|nr:GNAT family N-acetyltransferase [Anaerolineae bacterium]
MDSAFAIRRATLEDLPVIIAHRRGMFEAMGHHDESKLSAMEAKFEIWLKEKMTNDDYMGWVIVNEKHEVVASVGLWLREWIVNPNDLSGLQGHVMNVYTHPDYRRRGFSRTLMNALIDWCNEQGLNTVLLHPTNDSISLYQSMGFEPDNLMIKRLPV